MKRIFLIVIIAMLTAVSSWALTASEAFVSAPSSVFPLLDKSTRLDMIDYFNSGSATPSKNKLAGQSRILSIGGNDLRFEMSNASRYQVVVLPYGSEEIIALIETVATPAPDSNITFFSTDWQKLASSCFEVPDLKAWLTKEGNKNREQVEMMVPFMLVGYEYDDGTQQLTLTNNISKFLSDDIYEQISAYLYDKLVYRWNGKRMEQVK